MTAAQLEEGTPSLAEAPEKRKPRRRTTRWDGILGEAEELARNAVLEITSASTVGAGHSVRGEEDRLSTHLFECTLPGYRGWLWFATVARAPRSKKVTVCEVGLLPGDDALLAPEWVPWAERVRPEDVREDESAEEAEDKDAASSASSDAEEPSSEEHSAPAE